MKTDPKYDEHSKRQDKNMRPTFENDLLEVFYAVKVISICSHYPLQKLYKVVKNRFH